jgi:hypothetical protein
MENTLFFITFAFYLFSFAFTIARLQRFAGDSTSEPGQHQIFPQRAVSDNVS